MILYGKMLTARPLKTYFLFPASAQKQEGLTWSGLIVPALFIFNLFLFAVGQCGIKKTTDAANISGTVCGDSLSLSLSLHMLA